MRSTLKIKRIGTTLFFLLMIAGETFAQSKVINLWDKKIPGAISKSDYKETNSEDSWMQSVTNPRLDMYPAPSEKSTGTAVIICSGGGYAGMAVGHEGKQIAQWLNGLGITAFVLKYRLPDISIMTDKSAGPLQDGQQAVRLVRSHAKNWEINPKKIGIMGFSAGGHLASSLSAHFNEKVYDPADTTSARPDFSLLIYPVISMREDITHMGSRVNLLGENPSSEQVKHFSNELQVTSETPPAFLVHSMDDAAVPVENSMEYALALKKYKIPCELHIYERGGHGYGLAKSGGTESYWSEACSRWLKERGLIN
ncbi:alpha/beta hydrolase [Flavobacterium piscis]|uniref:Acetyl esterase/lipase n=1 Tax=Flavobacterium piscis TaxID=1114874 RepID=A0ABU1Y7Q8_9FLAO|nr:alpha/beta hydrolase [Flavobacterium piscis]MDR7210284.1 acetyl esterase/lipase [Flavobacterium piscis]